MLCSRVIIMSKCCGFVVQTDAFVCMSIFSFMYLWSVNLCVLNEGRHIPSRCFLIFPAETALYCFEMTVIELLYYSFTWFLSSHKLVSHSLSNQGLHKGNCFGCNLYNSSLITWVCCGMFCLSCETASSLFSPPSYLHVFPVHVHLFFLLYYKC